MPLKKPRKFKPRIIEIDLPIWKNQVLVAVNQKQKDLIAWLRKKKAHQDFVDFVSDLKDLDKYGGTTAMCEKGVSYGAIFVHFNNQAEDTWKFWDVVLHECVHIALLIAQQKCFSDEQEAMAYTTEYIFKEIRLAIMK